MKQIGEPGKSGWIGLVLAIIAGWPCLVGATEISAPLGARRVVIQGDGATTILGSGGLRSAAVFEGTGEISGSTLIGDPGEWEPGCWADGYYVELAGGEWSAITGNTADRLFLASELPAASDMEPPVASGVPFRIHRFNTLNSLFGEANGAGFRGGRHIGEADILIGWDNAAQVTSGLYYFNEESGVWMDAFNAPSGDKVLEPDACFIISGAGETHAILLTGAVRFTAATGSLTGDGATNLLPNPFPFDLRIDGSGLEFSLMGGPDIGTADFLAAFDPRQQLVTRLYYFNTREQAWRDSFDSALGPGDVIPSGSGVIAVRHSAGATAWQLEQPEESEFTSEP